MMQLPLGVVLIAFLRKSSCGEPAAHGVDVQLPFRSMTRQLAPFPSERSTK